MSETIDLSFITEVVQSGWTDDIYLDDDLAAIINNGDVLVWRGLPLHEALLALVEGWEREETEDGGVVTYRRKGQG